MHEKCSRTDKKKMNWISLELCATRIKTFIFETTMYTFRQFIQHEVNRGALTSAFEN